MIHLRKLGALLLLCACGGDHGSATPGDATAGTPLEIEPEPRLRLGVVQGDSIQEFHRVVTPFLMHDGRLVVPVSGASAIRVFGPDGGHQATLGGPGQGPGEFAALGAAWARGDTIEAYDFRLRRFTRFLPDGEVQVVVLHTAPRSANGAVPAAVRDGWVMKGVDGSRGNRDRIAVHRVALDGTYLGEIGETLGITRHLPAGGPGPGGPEPLSPRAAVRASGDRIFIGETLTAQLEILDLSGAPAGRITWEADPPGAPAAAFRQVADAAVARANPEAAESTRQRLDAIPVPDRLSVWWDVIIDQEGFTWIRPYEPLRHAAQLGGLSTGSGYLDPGAGRGGEWLLFSPEGAPAGSIQVPADLRPVQVTQDAIVGMRRDELGVESVQVHRLTRR